MSRQDLFRKQQARKNKRAGHPLIHEAAPAAKVQEILNCEVDQSRLESWSYLGDLVCPIEVPPAEAKALVNSLKNSFDEERLEKLLSQTQNDLIHSITGPFGLGRLQSAYDKSGGKVDTIYNVRQGIYATDEERKTYDARGKYDTHKVHQHENYKDRNRADSKQRKESGIEDGYRAEELNRHDKADLDHINSGKHTHDDPARILAEINTEDLANIDQNFTSTDRSVNRSKGAKSPEEFSEYLERGSPVRKERIIALEGNPNLSDKEKAELNKLKKLDSVDTKKLIDKGNKAQDAQDNVLNKEYYSSKKFAKNTVHSSVSEGATMAVQQAAGLLMVEFFTACFDEIKDIFKDGLKEDSLFSSIKIRLTRVSTRIILKWKDAVSAFSDGFISGFISNLVTILINAFATTGKRIVRMIREGLYSLFKALKILLFPPEELTYREAAHESMKLLASGGIVLAGIALEEVVEKLILSIPLLVPIAPIISTIIVGSITTIGMALTSYMIDKVDLLNIVRVERDQFVIDALDENIRNKLDDCNRVAAEIDGYLI